MYRRAIDPVVGRGIVAVEVDDHQAMAVELRHALPGRRIVGARRRGKHVLVDLDDDHVLGLHFGMTGRLIVDRRRPPSTDSEVRQWKRRPAWNRLVVTLADGEVLRVNDPRR
ncbi:MAG: DNA-formamidopyrimidine glycosylase family protein [Ilumatobacteraceae bacterium]